MRSPADAYIINTCSVTAVSDKKSRQMIRRANERNPQAVVAVCGCYAQTRTRRRADAGRGPDRRHRRPAWSFLDPAGAGRRRSSRSRDGGGRCPAPPQPSRCCPPAGMEGRTRAMLKVEDGCVNFCTYCIIPYARGPVRSLPLEEAVRAGGAAGGGRATGRSSSPASRSPPGAQDLKDGTQPHRPAGGGVRRRCRRCACGWAAWSPAPSRRISAAGPPRLPNLCPQFHLSMQIRLRRHPAADERRKYDTARFLRVRDSAAAVFPPARHHHGSDRAASPARRRRSFPRRWTSCAGATLPRCTSSPTPSAPAPRRRRWSRSPRPGEGGAVPPVRRRWRRSCTVPICRAA